MKKIIKTDKAPSAIGPYSQAVLIGDLLFTSGQIPINPETGEMVEQTIEAQTTMVMENLKGVLAAEDVGFDNVVKTTIYISDMNNFSKVNEIYKSYFKDIYPSRSCIEVSRLPKDALIEIEMIVHK